MSLNRTQKPLELAVTAEAGYNIGKITKIDQAVAARDNMLHIYNQRGNGILVADILDESTAQRNYEYIVPCLRPSKYYHVWLSGYWWRYATEGQTAQTVEVYIYPHPTGTALDRQTINLYDHPIPALQVEPATVYVQCTVDESTIASSQRRFKIEKPSNVRLAHILIVDENKFTIDYDVTNINRIGSIHDEGVNTILNASRYYKAYHSRVLYTNANQCLVTNTSWQNVLEENIPYLGKQYASETTNQFKIVFHVSALSDIMYARFAIFDISESLQTSGSSNQITATGWHEITFSTSHISKNMDFERYINIQAYVAQDETATIDSITIYADH